MLELTIFYLILYSINFTKRSTRILNDLVDLSAILTKYHKFGNISSKTKAKTLVLHHLYNLQIKLENKEKLPIKIMYSLSTTKQETLKEFISKNLNTKFIYPTSFLYRVLL